jgi:hypothetical protein
VNSRTCWNVAIATPGVRKTRSSAASNSPTNIPVNRISRVPQTEKCDCKNVDAVIPSNPPCPSGNDVLDPGRM